MQERPTSPQPYLPVAKTEKEARENLWFTSTFQNFSTLICRVRADFYPLAVSSNGVSHSVVSDPLVTPWTVARQALLSMEFSRQEYWSGLPMPSPGDLPDPGVNLGFPTLQADSLPSESPGSTRMLKWVTYCFCRGSSWPRDQTWVSCMAGRFFPVWAIRETLLAVKESGNALWSLYRRVP